MMDYLCGKFGDCSFSRFGSIMQTYTHRPADKRYTLATVVNVSKNESFFISPLVLKTVLFWSLQMCILTCVSHTAHVLDSLYAGRLSVTRWYCVETAQPIVKSVFTAW